LFLVAVGLLCRTVPREGLDTHGTSKYFASNTTPCSVDTTPNYDKLAEYFGRSKKHFGDWK